jgi:hypothetical protein
VKLGRALSLAFADNFNSNFFGLQPFFSQEAFPDLHCKEVGRATLALKISP